MNDLASLVFNYASVVDEDTLPTFKQDVATIQCLYKHLERMEENG